MRFFEIALVEIRLRPPLSSKCFTQSTAHQRTMNVVERKRERAAKSRRKGDTEACSRHELRGKDFSMYFSASKVPLGLATNFTLACPYTILAHYGELDWEAGFSVEAGLVRVSLGRWRTRGWRTRKIFWRGSKRRCVQLKCWCFISRLTLDTHLVSSTGTRLPPGVML